MKKFINREKNLERLKSRYISSKAEFIILYGRRRLGKSELVRKSIENREDAVYYQAIESTAQNQLDNFADVITNQFPDLKRLRRDWETLLEALGDRDAIVIIDEFPFIIEEDESILSRIQRIWDTHLKDTSMTLVLIGSSISIMEDKVIGGSSPLYGRRTATIDLDPLKIEDAVDFFPNYDPETKIKTWAIYGGTPYYLQTINPDKPLKENVQKTILSEQGLLYSEPEFLLRTELRQPNTYFSILRAIARGRRTPNEIAGMAGIEPQKISTYLKKLQRLRIIDRHIPVTESPTSSKRGRYQLSTPLFRFWFRFIYGNHDSLLLLGEDAFDEIVAEDLPDYVSPLFEKLCQEKLPKLIQRQYLSIGQWWFKQHELDILALTKKGLIAGECKFTSKPINNAILDKLEKTTKHVKWPEKPKKAKTHYVLFSKSGYTSNLKKQAQNRNDLHLFNPSDII